MVHKKTKQSTYVCTCVSRNTHAHTHTNTEQSKQAIMDIMDISGRAKVFKN